MKNTIAWLVLLVVLGAAAAFIYLRQHPVAPGRKEVPQAQAPAPGRMPPKPPARYPVPGAQGPATRVHGAQPAEPLPALGDSDRPVSRRLSGLFGAQGFTALFRRHQVLQRVVVTLDNVTGRQLPLRYLPVKPVDGRFRVMRKGGRLYISPRNYRRYAPYVRLAESVDSDGLLAFYKRFYPLFQEVYESLGYKGYFNDRLVDVIDNLLAAPEVRGPVKLIQPSVYYKYADPRLESLTAGQKILVRMGPANARRIKAKLRELRRGLLHLGRNGRGR